ncbi:hypothetical protein Acy02nite_82390 [Actinoplanes cyaneus]|uniref:Uncharacterized protein n=1 Tax=Actinoplanes cyaneus TaxID=52696 RepID=A0A919MAB7_9ACTN|nr:hypothetical protein [Actinoplanes cyaneus]GID70358.1 hypothetical protein Acy02nite_82390 [Actinoplanes cyaneus]
MGHQPEHSESFAGLVRAAESDGSDRQHAAGVWPRPISDGRWIDDRGIHWQIRGRELEPAGPPLRRLLKRADLRFLHAYGAHPREVSGRESEALLERVGRFAAGDVPAHSAFRLAEFRSNDRQAMLVIEEAC